MFGTLQYSSRVKKWLFIWEVRPWLHVATRAI